MPGTSARPLVLAVIDGLTPEALEAGLAAGRVPALAALAAHGSYGTATTTFPSVTPVCLTSIATGAHPDVHHIPHLVWYHRGEGRIVEYGSSFAAIRAAGTRRSIRDSIFEMSHAHLSARATTVFEALEDEGLVAGAINFTCYRGRTRHPIRLPALARRNRWYEAVYGPQRFFFFNLFESDVTGAPLAVRSRIEGSVDAYAAAVGRWLVTRDGFDFLVFYLPDYDYAAHAAGPDGALAALERSDTCLGSLFEAAGGAEEFLERYAVLLCSDHGQSPVLRGAQLASSYPEEDVLVTASNRAAMVYRLGEGAPPARDLGARLEGEPSADVVLFREGDEAVARRGGEELRFRPGESGWELAGDAGVLEEERFPNGLERSWCALACPHAGEVVVSAAEGWEFADLGGRHHAGGGSHGSLAARDSTVPVLAAGFEEDPLPGTDSITDLAPLVLEHFGIEAPRSMRARIRA